MANAYKVGDRVLVKEGIKLNGKFFYGDIAANIPFLDTAVEKTSPTVFEIVQVREHDHRRTSLSPPEPTAEDYIYRFVVHCGTSMRRVTYAKRRGAKPLSFLIPHTSIREVERASSADLQTSPGVFHANDIVCVTVPFEYPSTVTGSLSKIVLERGTLLQIQSPGATTQRGGPHTKSDPNKAFYTILIVDGTVHYDVYWKASSYVMHNEILRVVPSN